MNRRNLFKKLIGVGGAVAASSVVLPSLTAAPAAEPIPQTAPVETVKWPCMGCQHANETALLIWPSVKFRLQCVSCGKRQSYVLWLKKFDPNPTDFTQQFHHSPLADLTPTSELMKG